MPAAVACILSIGGRTDPAKRRCKPRSLCSGPESLPVSTRDLLALWNLDHRVARATIAKVLREQGCCLYRSGRPPGGRSCGCTGGAIAGADFFTTEVWTAQGLVTYYTLFVIDLASRPKGRSISSSIGIGARLLSLAPVGERRFPTVVEGPWRTISP